MSNVFSFILFSFIVVSDAHAELLESGFVDSYAAHFVELALSPDRAALSVQIISL